MLVYERTAWTWSCMQGRLKLKLLDKPNSIRSPGDWARVGKSLALHLFPSGATWSLASAYP